MKDKNEQGDGRGFNDVNQLLADDLELLLREITDFCAASSKKAEDIPETLENYMFYVSRSGNTIFPWQIISPLFRIKMLAAIEQFAPDPEPCENEAFALERFDIFKAAPFTIQRFAELITDPNRHYKCKDKYLRGLEKTLLVVSTIEPRNLNEPPNENIHNGMDIGNDNDEEHGSNSSNVELDIFASSHQPLPSLNVFSDMPSSFATRAFVIDDSNHEKMDILNSDDTYKIININMDHLQNYDHHQLSPSTSTATRLQVDTDIEDTLKQIIHKVVEQQDAQNDEEIKTFETFPIASASEKSEDIADTDNNACEQQQQPEESEADKTTTAAAVNVSNEQEIEVENISLEPEESVVVVEQEIEAQPQHQDHQTPSDDNDI